MDTTFSSVKIFLHSIEEKTTIDLGDYSGTLYIIDAADGRLFSSYQCDGLIKSIPCVHASLDIVYVGAHDQFSPRYSATGHVDMPVEVWFEIAVVSHPPNYRPTISDSSLDR